MFRAFFFVFEKKNIQKKTMFALFLPPPIIHSPQQRFNIYIYPLTTLVHCRQPECGDAAALVESI